MSQNEVITIDIDKIVASKSGGKKIPRFLVNGIKRFVHQDYINDYLRQGKLGYEFAEGALSYMDITVTVEGEENIPEDGLFTFAGNHPLGGADALAIVGFLGRKYDLKIHPRASGKERMAAFKDAFWGLLMPVIILGGIYSGWFTPTEAAAVSVFYGLAVGVFVYKEINFKKLIDILIDSCSTTATVMFITMGATLFAYVLTRARLDLTIKDFMLGVTNGNWIVFFIIVNIVLLIAGCFLDSTSALYIFTPLFAPVAAAMGIDPIHLGVVMIVNLAIGLFTPSSLVKPESIDNTGLTKIDNSQNRARW